MVNLDTLNAIARIKALTSGIFAVLRTRIRVYQAASLQFNGEIRQRHKNKTKPPITILMVLCAA